MDDPSYKRLLKHKRIVKDLLSGFIAPQRAPGWAGALARALTGRIRRR